MTKKDYVRAATIVRSFYDAGPDPVIQARGGAIEEAFVQFFRGDHSAFDEDRFRGACKPAKSKQLRRL